jgi:hypothetical protein
MITLLLSQHLNISSRIIPSIKSYHFMKVVVSQRQGNTNYTTQYISLHDQSNAVRTITLRWLELSVNDTESLPPHGQSIKTLRIHCTSVFWVSYSTFVRRNYSRAVIKMAKQSTVTMDRNLLSPPQIIRSHHGEHNQHTTRSMVR